MNEFARLQFDGGTISYGDRDDRDQSVSEVRCIAPIRSKCKSINHDGINDSIKYQ